MCVDANVIAFIALFIPYPLYPDTFPVPYHLTLSPYYNMKIMAIADENPVVLPNDITLALVRRDICDNPMNHEIILYYRVFPSPAFT